MMTMSCGYDFQRFLKMYLLVSLYERRFLYLHHEKKEAEKNVKPQKL